MCAHHIHTNVILTVLNLIVTVIVVILATPPFTGCLKFTMQIAKPLPAHLITPSS